MIESFSVTFLGTGTSQGVPMIACECEVCKSSDPHDKRLRSSVMLTINGHNYVIDAGPDFRYQMLRENVKDIDGILFTHEHKDHTAGLDDVRPFNYFTKKDIQIYCDDLVEKALRHDYYYAFAEHKYPGVPKLDLISIDKDHRFQLQIGVEVQPIQVMHYKLPITAYRIGDFAYITDCKTIADEEREKLRGVKVMVCNALRREEHISHMNLQQALELIDWVKPENAYLTHISHAFDKHVNIEKELPSNVHPAYDGLKLILR